MTDEELEASKGVHRAALITCGVVAAAIVAGVVLLVGVIAVFVAGRDVGPARTPEDRTMTVVNGCPSVVRVGWVLSDTVVPFTAADAQRFFPSDRGTVESSPARPTNPTSAIRPGQTGFLGVGRAETAGAPRILVVEVSTAGPPTVTSWQMTPALLPSGTAGPTLSIEGPACAPSTLKPAPLA